MIGVERYNMEALLADLESEKEMPYQNSFLDTDEGRLLDEVIYNKMKFNKYGNAVRSRDNSL